MSQNEAYQEKLRDLKVEVSKNKEVKRQIESVKKTFQTDSNYEWMIEIENQIKSDKQTLGRLKEENSTIRKIYDKESKLLQQSEQLIAKNADV